ncbi:MAG: transposase [Chitinophagales bacterium]|nr:transposase [Chitinophagales bacterium]
MQTYFPQFFTATIYKWYPLLKESQVKDIIIESMVFLAQNQRVFIHAFVIMDNHIHIIWKIRTPHLQKNVQRDFLKYTAQQIKFYLQRKNSEIIELCKVNHNDRKYMIWQTNSMSVDLYTEKVYNQKLDYIHNNPIKAKYCEKAEDYIYSSADYYYLNKSKWKFINNEEE